MGQPTLAEPDIATDPLIGSLLNEIAELRARLTRELSGEAPRERFRAEYLAQVGRNMVGFDAGAYYGVPS